MDSSGSKLLSFDLSHRADFVGNVNLPHFHETVGAGGYETSTLVARNDPWNGSSVAIEFCEAGLHGFFENAEFADGSTGVF